MPDFRQELYRRYITTFKIAESHMDNSALQSYWDWCEYKYLPLLDGLDRNGAILELGCGPGYMMEFLKKHGFSNIRGIDISEEQIRIATGRGLNAKVADAFEFLHSTENTFNAIIAIDFVEHFTKDELIRLIPGIYRALKEGGMLIIQTINGQGIFPHQVIFGDFTHLTVFTSESLGQILRLGRFDEITFRETGPVPKTIKGKIQTILWKLIKLMANTIRRIETGKTQELWTENMICCCRKPYG